MCWVIVWDWVGVVGWMLNCKYIGIVEGLSVGFGRLRIIHYLNLFLVYKDKNLRIE